MKRRIISFLLALAMMVSLLPTGVFSIQSYAQETDWGYTVNSGEVTITGYSGTATDLVIPSAIEGLPVTTIGDSAFEFCHSLTSITIPDSVTTIGYSAFRYCDSLTSITIPDSVTTIDDAAFEHCDSLTSITIPDSVTTIGSDAFAFCDSLTSVTIGNGVTAIGDYAFEYCRSLTSITIPDSVTTIGDYAFEDCYSLTSITIPDSVTTIGNNAFYYCANLTSVTMGSGVTTIGSYAFSHCTSLTSITIPDGVTTIGSSAFAYCDNLTSITIPDSVTAFNYWAFGGCTKLSYHVYDNAKYLGNENNPYMVLVDTTNDNITECLIHPETKMIAASAFRNCSSLTSITIPDSVTTIGNYAFVGCENLTEVNIPDGIETIQSGTFAHCSKLTNVDIPETVTTIESLAFSGVGCTMIYIPASVTNISCSAFGAIWTGYGGDGNAVSRNLQKIVVDANNPAYTSDDNGVLYSKDMSTLIRCPSGYSGVFHVPASVTTIGDDAFNHCENITEIYMTDNVESIGASSFTACKELQKIVLSNNISTIGRYVFIDCSSLTSVTIPDSVTRIDEGAFAGCASLISVTIGNGVTSIGPCVFAECVSLTNVTIGNSVTTIGFDAFYSCSNLSYHVYNNAKYLGNENNPYMVLVEPTNDNITECLIHPDTKIIADSAFNSCSNLSYHVYDNAKYLGNENNPYLVLVEATNASITECQIHPDTKIIAGSAFDSCDSLTSITIPDSVITIGEGAFWGCDSLTSITIPDSVTTIDDTAFMYCSCLTSITIPDSVTTIGSYAFAFCDSLTGITIPDSVTTIGEYAFYYCYSLTTVYYGGTEAQRNEIAIASGNENLLSATWQYKEVVDEEADWDYTINGNEVTITGYNGTETDLVIPSAIEGLPVTTIGEYAFYYCTSLTSITIPDGVTTIGVGAFSGCDSLTGITIPDGVTTIGVGAFACCDSLTSITIPDSVTTIGNDAFCECDSLTSVTMGNSVTSIGDGAFYYCSSLTGITIPDSVTSIGDRAFYYCSSLTSITIPDGVTTIGVGAFEDCDSLTGITIPDSVTTIGSYAFAFCDSLTGITIPDSVTTIGEYAFYYCYSLTTVYYGGTEAQREKIAIASGNEDLLSATWHYKEVVTITTQPQDAECALDDYAVFTVVVNNDNVTYQWQYKGANSAKWLDSTAQDATTASLRIQMKAYRAGQQYRCVITTADGEQLISEAATMTVKSGEIVINSQPVSVGNAVLGKTSQFTVDAATLGDEDISYQWYVYNASKGEWERSYLEGCNTATLTVSVTRFRVGLQYKCVITSGLNEVETDVVTLNMQQIVMEEQNAQFADKIGGNAVLSVNATGNVLKYQWYFSNDGETWKVSGLTGNKTNELTVKTLAYRVGQIYRCKITDVNGQVTWSDPVALTVG